MQYYSHADNRRSKTIYRRRLHPWVARHPADLSRKAARPPRRLGGRVDLPLKLAFTQRLFAAGTPFLQIILINILGGWFSVI